MPDCDSQESAAAPAARCGSGQWRRVGSPLCRSARRLFRSRWVRAVAHRLEYRCALVRVIALLKLDADPKLSSHSRLRSGSPNSADKARLAGENDLVVLQGVSVWAAYVKFNLGWAKSNKRRGVVAREKIPSFLCLTRRDVCGSDRSVAKLPARCESYGLLPLSPPASTSSPRSSHPNFSQTNPGERTPKRLLHDTSIDKRSKSLSLLFFCNLGRNTPVGCLAI
jgi:hypothetical protein